MNATRSTREQRCRKASGEILNGTIEIFDHTFDVLASPAWRGIESDIWRVETKSESLILKHYHDDVNFYVNAPLAIEAAREAGKIGVGPIVLKSWRDDGLIAFEQLKSPWRAGGLHDAVDPSIRSHVIAQKKIFQSKARLSNEISIFTEIGNLYGIAKENQVKTHNDIAVFIDYFESAKSKFDSFGTDSVACHRDGNTANLMIGPDYAVSLLDFDLSANCDPFEDIGCFLIEFFECDAEARGGFEEWYGCFNEALYQRSMIYGLADDLRWGLIASILATNSSRRSLEFSKYAAWRFIRLEMQLKGSSGNDRIRQAA